MFYHPGLCCGLFHRSAAKWRADTEDARSADISHLHINLPSINAAATFMLQSKARPAVTNILRFWGFSGFFIDLQC